jgi:microcin C transport system substrate-binding protein
MPTAIRLALAVALTCSGFSAAAHAEEGDWRHGLSLFGELKYDADFEHFDYVNPDAPKGGIFRQSSIGTFDSLHPFTIRGTPAAGLGLIYDTLMSGALDEPSSEYGLIAESVRYPEDYSWVTYRLRPEARFHDGEPVKPEDVIFSLEALKASHPFYNAYYRHVVSAEKTGEREVTFQFDESGNRELPQITGQLFVLHKHWWEGADERGRDRDFAASTLEPPLGSGPYRIGRVQAGRTITYERVDDYWASDLPVNVGTYNFDEIRYEYFRNQTVAQEAFRGDAFDFTIENSARRWATAYDFPAVSRGDVVLDTFRTANAEPMQAFVFNTRHDKLSDPRVRRAFNYAFDFEWMNANIFYDQYERTSSYFQNSELAAEGLPEGLELEILEEIRDQVPPEVFTEEYSNPVGGDTRRTRENLRAAGELLREAGWEVRDGVLTNAETGEAMRVEFLLVQPDMERIVNPYLRNLQRLGIQGTIRTVDVSQYRNRTDNFDFDIIVSSFAQSLSPGNEQRDFWGSDSAEIPGSRNLIGIQNPAVDHLIERIIFAPDREALVAASRALDRVLLWNHYLVPQFYSPDIRTARWNRYGLPENMPEYGFSTTIWWWDEEKASTVQGS